MNFKKKFLGGEDYQAGKESYGNFAMARRLFIAMNVVQSVGGVAKVWIELNHAYQDTDNGTKQFSLPALVDGASDISLGASWLVANTYYATKAASLAQNPETLNEAIEILRIHAITIPPKILWGARMGGVIAPAYSLFQSGKKVYIGATDKNLNDSESRDMVISGTLGSAASLAFIGFAYFITPAAIPIGVSFFATGTGLIAIQTGYDEREAIGEYMAEFKRNPLTQLQNVGAQTTNVLQAVGTTGINFIRQTTSLIRDAVQNIPFVMGAAATLQTTATAIVSSTAVATAAAGVAVAAVGGASYMIAHETGLGDWAGEKTGDFLYDYSPKLANFMLKVVD